MYFLLALVANVVRASSDGPTLNPTHVEAGQLTMISLVLKGPFDCTNEGFPFLRLKVLDEAFAQGAYILPSNESYKYPPEKDLKVQPEFGKLITYPSTQDSIAEIKAKFEYYDPSENNGAHLKIDVFCGTESQSPNLLPVKLKQLLDQDFLKLTVFEHPISDQQVTLTPDNVMQKEVSTIAFSSTWPYGCRNHNPTIKLMLDSASVTAGGALSSEPIPEYFVKGSRNFIITDINSIKSNKTIEADRYDALIFHKRRPPTSNKVKFDFKFLGQSVPEATVYNATINVAFICNRIEFLPYPEGSESIPTLKVNTAQSASLASGFLLAFLLTLIFL